MVAGVIPIVREIWAGAAWLRFLPSGVAAAIGMLIEPNWTIPRVLGAVAQFMWLRKWPGSCLLQLIPPLLFQLHSATSTMGC